MESILIVLAALGGFIYKIYTNYKEEMEKANKRKASMPSMPPPVEQPVSQGRRQQYTPPPVPSMSYKQLSKNTDSKEVNTFDFPEEVRKIREQKSQRLQTQLSPEVEKIKVNPIEFDLRKAVILSAILERPYK